MNFFLPTILLKMHISIEQKQQNVVYYLNMKFINPVRYCKKN
jgi:hypothetical protein